MLVSIVGPPVSIFSHYFLFCVEKKVQKTKTKKKKKKKKKNHVGSFFLVYKKLLRQLALVTPILH